MLFPRTDIYTGELLEKQICFFLKFKSNKPPLEALRWSIQTNNLQKFRQKFKWLVLSLPSRKPLKYLKYKIQLLRHAPVNDSLVTFYNNRADIALITPNNKRFKVLRRSRPHRIGRKYTFRFKQGWGLLNQLLLKKHNHLTCSKRGVPSVFFNNRSNPTTFLCTINSFCLRSYNWLSLNFMLKNPLLSKKVTTGLKSHFFLNHYVMRRSISYLLSVTTVSLFVHEKLIIEGLFKRVVPYLPSSHNRLQAVSITSVVILNSAVWGVLVCLTIRLVSTLLTLISAPSTPQPTEF